VRATTVLGAGETLLVSGEPEASTHLLDDSGLGLTLLGEEPRPIDAQREEGLVLVEALVGPRAPVIGISIGRLDLGRRTGAAVLAISRQGSAVPQRVSATVLQAGDVLLLQGTPERIAEACQGRGLIPLEEARTRVRRGGVRAVLATAIFVAALGAAALGLVQIQLAVTLGVALAILLGLLGADEAYAAVDWHILVFIAGMTPLAGALVQTGVAGGVAQVVVGLAHRLGGGPRIELALLFVLAAALTQALSNVATVLVLAPMALSVARILHQPPQLFVAVVVAAVSAAPITPMSSKVNLLVMGPGGYRYGDFVRYGLPLTLLLGAVTVVLAPVLVGG
jgi:di/tricarboxylate transporter